MHQHHPRIAVKSLSALGEVLRAKSYAAGNAAFIQARLCDFIRFTEPAHRSNKTYLFDRKPDIAKMAVKSAERRLEATLLERFYSATVAGTFLSDIQRLVAYQVPLFAQQAKQGWGSIDLLGLGHENYPVVIELKIHHRAVEPPLRALIEALAYMVALRHENTWKHFGPEWSRAVGLEKVLPAPETMDAVILGTADYWKSVSSDKYHRAGFGPLIELTKACSQLGYRFRWAEVRAKGKDARGAWDITGSIRDIFPDELPASRTTFS